MPNNLLVRALIFLFFSHVVILFCIYAFPDYVSPIEALLPISINTTALSAAMTAAFGARPALLTRSLLLSNPQQCTCTSSLCEMYVLTGKIYRKA
jgi:hypothetical protein